jgi:hypothetical protein
VRNGLVSVRNGYLEVATTLRVLYVDSAKATYFFGLQPPHQLRKKTIKWIAIKTA